MKGKYNHYCHFFVYRADFKVDELRLQKDELERVRWCNAAELQRECKLHPEKFGNKFELILETILPLLN